MGTVGSLGPVAFVTSPSAPRALLILHRMTQNSDHLLFWKIVNNRRESSESS